MALFVYPLTIKKANQIVSMMHRTHLPVRGGLFAVGVGLHPRSCVASPGPPGQARCVGAAIAGRPSARHLDDGASVEILRVATDGTQNACSKLIGALTRAARELGYVSVYTYTMEEEPGTSLVATGFELDAMTRGGSWSRGTRPRSEQLHVVGPKKRWVRHHLRNINAQLLAPIPVPSGKENSKQQMLFI